MAEAVAEEYRSSLSDLNFNSKPHINMLTMLAEDNIQYASLIVDTIVNHIKTVPPDLKLPSLYLVDSIMKNIGGKYITQFSKHMVELFASVFEKVEETTRSALYKLRQTWNEILPKNILYGIDHRVNSVDPAWPITAQVTSKSIHVNPKFVSAPTSQSAQDLVKEAEIKKGQGEVLKMLHEKKEREEMLRLIEEKRAQLRILEAKKLEQLQRAAQKGLGKALLDHAKKTTVNHRDPRLKKVAAVKVCELEKLENKPNPTSLQSVVVVPGSESQNADARLKFSPKIPPTEDTQLSNSISDPSRQPGVTQVNLCQSKEELKNGSNKNSCIVDQFNKRVGGKKRPLSSNKSVLENVAKKCKEQLPLNNSKLSHVDNNEVIHSYKDSGHVSKRIKSESVPNNIFINREQIGLVKDKRVPDATHKEISEKQFATDPRLPQPPLFLGTEDKDYRKISRMTENSTFQEEIPHPTSSIGATFHHRDQHPANIIPKENSIATQLHRPTENARTAQQQPLEQTLIKKDSMQVPVQNSGLNSSTVLRRESPIPFTQSFKLDGKDRIIHFVDKRAFAFMDDNKPHELSFIGSPRNVFIEGLPHPVTVGFDGKYIDAEICGKMNKIQFGTPSREIYINNRPYEVQFGGPPVSVMLEDNQQHHIRIDGPPPQVLISDKPAFELFEAFNTVKSAISLPSVTEQNIKTSETLFPVQDVDMRVKNNTLKQPVFFKSAPEKLQDVDWRHVPSSEGSQPTWGVPVSAADIIKKSGGNSTNPIVSSVPFRSHERFQIPSSMSFTHPCLGGGYSSVFQQPGDNIPKDILQPNMPWAEPNFRAMRLPPERHPVDNSCPHSKPSESFTSTTISPLPPPPRLPPALSSLTPPPPLPNLPPIDMCRPTWRPLPPPPMFPAPGLNFDRPKVPLLPTPTTVVYSETPTSTTNLPQQTVPELPLPVSVPIDVGTIFEKLVAAGIIPKKADDSVSNPSEQITEEKVEESSKDEKDETVPNIEFNSKSLKQFYPEVLIGLYKGSQCATCGMRFKNSQGDQYGRHLDWHFRMNRREKDGAKKAFSRRLFYDLKDWIQFTEIEEAEERAPSYFELQADGVMLKKEEIEKIHSVRASECETEKCSVCGEQFQLFWVEEEEEWHLRNAVRHDGEVYHPACFEDFKKASESTSLEADMSRQDTHDEVKEDSSMKMEVDEEKEQEAVDPLKVSIKKEPIDEEVDTSLNASSNDKEDIVKEEKTIQMKVEDNILVKEEPVDPEPIVAEEASEPSKIIVYIKNELLSEDESMETREPEEETQNKSAIPPTTDVNAIPHVADEESEDEEFRPPTPDPRFLVLPPTIKGKELSALCTIM